MSDFSKFLTQVTVGTGGWNFTFKEGASNRTVNIPAATYDTVLDLLVALYDAIDASYTNPVVTCSSVGIVAIGCDEMDTMNWALTSSGLLQLGFVGTEAPVSNLLTSTGPHHWGWYPGTITHGLTGGAGFSSDSGWQAVESVASEVSGAGERTSIGPSRPDYQRRLVVEAVRRDESHHISRGPIRFLDRWRHKKIRFYPDRDDGTVAGGGSQGDPGSPYFDDDSTCEYWLVRLADAPKVTEAGGFPDYFITTLTLGAEPITS